jgi:hypothetical protein
MTMRLGTCEVEYAAREARDGIYSTEEGRWWALTPPLKMSGRINTDATRREQTLTGAEGDEEDDAGVSRGFFPRL